MTVSLRPYQERAIATLRSEYTRGHRAVCLVLPTGAGKTVIAAEVIRSALSKGKRVLFAAHRTELLSQSVAKLEHSGITDVRLIRASVDTGTAATPVSVASIPTLASKNWRDRLPAADLVILDECHHTPAKTWASLASNYAHASLLGLTATPARQDGKPLGDIFDSIVVGATIRELTELGHLVPARIWAPPNALDSGELAIDPVQAYQDHAAGERAVVFCLTVEHAESVAADFMARGIEASVVHGQLSAGERFVRLQALKSGQLKVIVNVHVLTEGWDQPEVSTAILARKPQHAGLYLQIVGRVLRPANGKSTAKVLDLCGASLIHGTPDMEREYSLEGKAISTVDRENIRQCPHCGGVFRAGPQACPMCGATMPARPAKEPRSIGVGLSEVKQAIDVLRANLLAVAKRTKRSAAWVERAYQAIGASR